MTAIAEEIGNAPEAMNTNGNAPAQPGKGLRANLTLEALKYWSGEMPKFPPDSTGKAERAEWLERYNETHGRDPLKYYLFEDWLWEFIYARQYGLERAKKPWTPMSLDEVSELVREVGLVTCHACQRARDLVARHEADAKSEMTGVKTEPAPEKAKPFMEVAWLEPEEDLIREIENNGGDIAKAKKTVSSKMYGAHFFTPDYRLGEPVELIALCGQPYYYDMGRQIAMPNVKSHHGKFASGMKERVIADAQTWASKTRAKPRDVEARIRNDEFRFTGFTCQSAESFRRDFLNFTEKEDQAAKQHEADRRRKALEQQAEAARQAQEAERRRKIRMAEDDALSDLLGNKPKVATVLTPEDTVPVPNAGTRHKVGGGCNGKFGNDKKEHRKPTDRLGEDEE